MRLVDPAPHKLDPLDAGLTYFRAPEPDHEQAVYWFRVSADSGDTEGLAMLGLCQLEGLGLPRDPVQALERLERASAEGSLTAKFHLARMLVGGWGGDPDAPRGVALYTAAAALGHADASFNLASCLEAGWGCQVDHLAAKALFMRARSLGSRLKAPGLRIRERELDAVRDLARRLENGNDLPHLIEERQHEITLMHDLAHRPARKPRLSARQRRRLLRAASITAIVAGLAAALAGLFGWRGSGPLAHDAGPTSTA
ncbi:tetratricopeptide repeat protein [Roseateles saccharophilus]|uniref:Sel1 repeat-containing protein n=1 Tax=Roseateles saccharophilus TaxID=304 RepID=A0A4V2VQF4_ROSSA|nr:tetratricopeptide repeat protein [Roseateles saccharophilus]TCU94419.1 Sel1 repeat-containing protein [Roseateles saccharophilus]